MDLKICRREQNSIIHNGQSHEIIYKLNILVIRTSTEFMGSTVDTPGDIKQEAPTEHGGYKPGVDEGLVPEVHGNDGGQNEASQRHQDHVVSEGNKIFIKFRLKVI